MIDKILSNSVLVFFCCSEIVSNSDDISLDFDSTPDLELLEAELQEAIDNEDYELASELRDQIDKIKNNKKDE